MRAIKYRQLVKPNYRANGALFHYWGNLEKGVFVSPMGANMAGDSEQFTGFKDRNGNPIFEGDIVDLIESTSRIKGEICFQDGSFCHCEEKRYTPFFRLVNSELEIIGNIHEHLLEADK